MSLNETALLIFCVVYICVTTGYRYMLRRYAQNLLWEMPWNKWQTFEEIRVTTKIPRLFLRRLLFFFMNANYVEFELDDTRGISREEMQQKVMEAIDPRKGLEFLEYFKYRRIVQPKRKRQRVKLPEIDFGWAPAKA
jgi:hypothetical protein